MRVAGIVVLVLLAVLESGAQVFRTSSGIYFKEGDPEKADHLLLMRVADSTTNPGLWKHLNLVAHDAGAINQAFSYLETKLTEEPNHAEHHLWLARMNVQYLREAPIYRKPFLAREVKHCYEKSLKLDPGQIQARQELITFHLKAPSIVGGSIAEAKRLAEELKTLNPAEAAYQHYRIRSEEYPSEAQGLLEKATGEFPNDVRFQHLKVYALMEQGQHAEAMMLLRNLKARYPHDAKISYTIGWVSAVSGEALELGKQELLYCVKQLEKVELELPPAEYVYYRLGQIYRELKQPRKAAYAFAKASNLEQAQIALQDLKEHYFLLTSLSP